MPVLLTTQMNIIVRRSSYVSLWIISYVKGECKFLICAFPPFGSLAAQFWFKYNSWSCMPSAVTLKH